ncbi:ATP-binding protein [Aureimonas sp. ME7]|uniref:ATP-binding protein n=1 Tax=Aureimonas sp. ME7 TaxID=2744252 RepID=UPI0015F5904C|nr:ATP-binding protein [Aureimonas sp. ME7]
MWNVATLDGNQVSKILSINENQFNDLKDKSNVAKCTKTLSAFANSDGGELFVGIRDSRESDRLSYLFQDEEEANGIIQQVFTLFAEGVEYVDIQFLDMDGAGLCLHIGVQKTPFVVKSSDGKIFKRINASDRELKTPAEISKLELEKGIRSYEDASVDATVDEIQGSVTTATFLENVVPHSSLVDFLKRERLITGDRLRLCSLILFDDNPQSLVPHSAVKVYRYRTLEGEGNREDLEGQPHTIEGPIYDLIYEAVRYTKEKVEEIPLLGDSGFVNVKYPPEAVHEVICNAVLHRDYSINDYVHIRIFDNRIEVESPGRLAGAVTIKNILKQRYARNKKTVRLVAKFPSPPNKDVGEGLNTAFKSMQQLNLGRPDIEETESSVIVRLRHEPLASKESLIRSYLLNQGKINNKTARRVCNVQSDSIIRKLFRTMISAGELEKVPGTRGTGTQYRIPTEPKI